MRSACFLLSLLMLAAAAKADDSPKWTITTQLRGRTIEGMPLNWSGDKVYLLGRDGHLWDFRPDEARDYRKTASSFRGYSPAELRAVLQRELGQHLDVTGTGHYLVAHPRNQGAEWAQRFEELYRSFVHYFSVRGLRPKEPQFPLVAIVWAKPEDLYRYAAAEGLPVGRGTLGYYSAVTNRVALYDYTAEAGRTGGWKQNAATIIHEATHQMAFNTGVHNRLALPPRWLAEGLGTLYEAPGVWNPHNYPARGDRINRGRLTQFREFANSGRPAAWFLQLVASDQPFRTSVGAAYAESWALTFFLSETEPAKYGQYLAKTAKRPAFESYSTAQRMADFTAIFGKDFRMMDANLLRFIAGLE